jgi:predicted dehydrogenase
MKHLVIGGGSIGKRHISNLRFLGELELYCLRRKHNKEFEEEYAVRVITTHDEVRSLAPDIVYICTPTHLRLETLEIASSLKSHIFVEKPLTHTKHDLDKIRKFINPDRVFFIGYMLRFHPAIQVIKTVLDSNAIGKIFNASFNFGSYLPSWHPYEDYKRGYAANSSMGGGVLNTISHEVDLIWYLFGMPLELYTVNKNIDRLGILAEEISDSILTYKDMSVSLHLDYLQKQYNRNIIIHGDQGAVGWSWTDGVVTKNIVGEQMEIIPVDIELNDIYIAELREFLNRIQKSIFIGSLDFDEAIKDSQLLLAMNKSAAEGIKVERTEWEKW